MKLLFLSENILNIDFIKENIAVDKIIYPWDTELYNKQSISLTRLCFIYEYLCSQPDIEIWHGSIQSVINELFSSVKIKEVYLPEIIDKTGYLYEHDYSNLSTPYNCKIEIYSGNHLLSDISVGNRRFHSFFKKLGQI